MTENFTREDIREALRPIASLISKSEKARTKLTPGTWQHTMLSENLKALRVASAMMEEGAGDTNDCALDDLKEALRASNSMINRTENAKMKFKEGTSQHTLQKNRLRALRIAEELIIRELEGKQCLTHLSS
jgi:hypothetical protein